MLGWHLLQADWRTYNGLPSRKPWKVGEKRKIRGQPLMGFRGYHFCRTLHDVLDWGYGDVLCRVEVPDKEWVGTSACGAATWRKILAGADCKDIFNDFAVLAGGRFLKQRGYTCGQVDDLIGRDRTHNRLQICDTIRQVVSEEWRFNILHLVNHINNQAGYTSARVAYNYLREVVDQEWAEEWLKEKVDARLALS